MNIQCLMVSGASLDEGIRMALYWAARKLLQSNKNYIRFKDENGEGGVSTKHQRRCVTSAMVGIEFNATVDYRSQTLTCRFLVNDINMPAEEKIIGDGLQWFEDVYDCSPDDWWKSQ